MRPRPLPFLALGLAALVVLALAAGSPALADTPKRGGVLTSVLIEDPPGLLIHESATVSNVWPHVKGLVAHNSLYNYGRMQDVGPDK
jgi:hypothetical protein